MGAIFVIFGIVAYMSLQIIQLKDWWIVPLSVLGIICFVGNAMLIFTGVIIAIITTILVTRRYGGHRGLLPFILMLVPTGAGKDFKK